jgi:hypothetical protein
MTMISLQLPDALHETARKLAEKENISINELIIAALAEKIAALMTEDYLMERAHDTLKEKFEAAVAKAADLDPDEADR